MTDTLTSIIQNAFDLHVHIGPEIIPRKFNVKALIKEEQGKIAGMAVKNHFFSTVPFIAEQSPTTPLLVGSVTLNSYVGGLNPDAVYAAGSLAKGPFIVWFPTVSAKQFLDCSEYELAPEWIGDASLPVRKAKDVSPISVLDREGKLTQAAKNVLLVIYRTDAILATGHLSWQESRKLVKEAVKIGIKRIILTHCIYQKIAMPITIQQELVSYGAKVEHCYSMYSIDKIPIENIAKEIQQVGPENCVISSDVGQQFSPPPSQALSIFAGLLLERGIRAEELRTMMVTNPRSLIGNVT